MCACSSYSPLKTKPTACLVDVPGTHAAAAAAATDVQLARHNGFAGMPLTSIAAAAASAAALLRLAPAPCLRFLGCQCRQDRTGQDKSSQRGIVGLLVAHRSWMMTVTVAT